ncbi:PKD domain-containing protein [Salibacter halophilus]|uniref:PKD domain-containing protein n=1 Tax=Salibacter halophilus TaxID=1803916 RepID=A0A6N6M4P3_9FLAO|nr:PKD domain-containing protein [Salibacter halophilus]KAB1061974.1 PKD domain-containing protein [Salibacter halophilus]
MKTLKTLGLLVLMSMLSYVSIAQSPSCSSSGCIVDTLILNTGYDHTTNSQYSYGDYDNYWRLTNVPSSSGLTLPSPSYVISPNSAWHNFPNSQWISAFNDNSYNTNNPVPDDPYSFENCFCICQDTTVYFNFEVVADDYGYVYLDNNLLAAGDSGYHFQYGNRIIVDTAISLTSGTHCLRLDMRNISGVAMGISLEGYMTGGSPLDQNCCNPNGSICGVKYLDQNCDSSYAGDPTLDGFEIILYDSLNNPIDTTITDSLGNYCFLDIPAGNYYVGEINQPGYVQTYPSSGQHNIDVTVGTVTGADFANCDTTTTPSEPDPCEEKLEIKPEIKNCKATFNLLNSPSNPWVLLSAEWTFGDGYSSNEVSPTHYYDAPGAYQVCVEVTYYNTETQECCTVKECLEIEIKEPCPEECQIDGEILVDFDECCEYEFSLNVNSNTEIIGYIWTLGDGTTLTGEEVEHIYTQAGGYQVCVTVIAEGPDGRCCSKRICIELEVPCEGKPQDDSSGKRSLGNDETDVDDQYNFKVYPNPTSDNVNIALNLSEKQQVQIRMFDINGRVVIEKNAGEQGAGSHKFPMSTSNLNTGMYFCYVTLSNGEVLHTKVVIE